MIEYFTIQHYTSLHIHTSPRTSHLARNIPPPPNILPIPIPIPIPSYPLLSLSPSDYYHHHHHDHHQESIYLHSIETKKEQMEYSLAAPTYGEVRLVVDTDITYDY